MHNLQNMTLFITISITVNLGGFYTFMMPYYYIVYRPTLIMVCLNAHIYMLKLMLLLRGKTRFQSLVPLKI